MPSPEELQHQLEVAQRAVEAARQRLQATLAQGASQGEKRYADAVKERNAIAAQLPGPTIMRLKRKYL